MFTDGVFRGPALLIVRSDARRRAGSLVGLALIVAIGAGASLSAFGAAHRTDTAYAQFADANDVGDLSVNPSLPTVAVDAAVRRFPGVVTVHSDALLAATVSQTGPATFEEIALSDDWQTLQVRGSSDGRYVDVDRPAISAGSFATGEREMFVSEDYHAELERAVGRPLGVGDMVDVAFWWSGFEVSPVEPDEIVAPIGVESLRIAGFGHLPDEVLPDELYPRNRIIVSADIATRYGCLADFRSDMDEAEATAAAFPPRCSRQYQYYSFTLDGSEGASAAIQQAFNDIAGDLTEQLPAFFQENAGYYFVSQARADLDAAVRQTTRPTVTALIVFGVVAALATLVIVALVVARGFTRDVDVQRIWSAVGATRWQTGGFAASTPLLAVTAGLIGATAAGFLLSPLGPLGSVRAVEPEPGFSVDGRVLVLFLVAVAAALVVIVGMLAALSSRRSTRTPSGQPTVSRTIVLLTLGGPAMTVGIRASLDRARAGANAAVLGGALVTIATGVAAVTFGTNLSTLVEEPQRYGWPWTAAVITGGGYGDTDLAVATAALTDHPDVVDHSFLAFDSSSRLKGRPVTALYGSGDVAFPILDGRAPRRSGEAIIGATIFRELDLSLGDRVSFESAEVGAEAVTEVVVVGSTVLPSLGPLISDRAGLGLGMYLAIDQQGLTPVNVTMTAIRLRDGTDPETFMSGLGDLRAWDLNFAPPYTYTRPVRPPEIVDVTAMRAAPLVVGGLLATALALGLALSMAVSVRDRRRELAILRALGFSDRQMRSTVRWQATSAIAVGLAAGVPLGILFGRWSWQAFAQRLGVVSRPEVPIGWLIVVTVIAMVVTQCAAAVPARASARVTPSETLRDS